MKVTPTTVAPMKYAHCAEVQGMGEFPFDMLRYDNAHPSEERDSAQLQAFQSRDKRTVRVTAMSGSKVWPFTPARWASFGWTCVPVGQWTPR